MRPGQSFESREVVSHYAYRPEYPTALYEKLLDLTEAHHSVLDLGCGTGKIARNVAGRFDSVTAIDPSKSMLIAAAELQSKRHHNIEWVCSLAEEAQLVNSPYDLVVAAASIHWMNHSLLFPRLLDHVTDDHVFAVVEGDEPHQPPWQLGWDAFMAKWIFALKGERYEPGVEDSAFVKKMERHRSWLALEGSACFEHTFTQSVNDFVLCQYSRDAFALSKLGDRATEFADDLKALLNPYADQHGMLTYRVQSRIEWGKIQAAA